jgi:hypothetical protein
MKDTPITLYIFATSEIPDLYINIIGYCIEHYDIETVVLLSILGDPIHKARNENFLSNVKYRIDKQLSLLQDGKHLYLDQDTKEWEEKSIDIEDYEKRIYGKIADKEIKVQVVIHDELDNEIDRFLRKGSCLFDVSGVLKRHLTDVFVLLRLKGVNELMVFELKRRTFDERELIHNLSLDRGEYEYVNIFEDKYTQGLVVKSPGQTLQLLEDYANNFAVFALVIYGIITTIIVFAAVYIVINGGWDILEPGAWLIGISWYTMSVVVVALFKKELSLNPFQLYIAVKEYKIRKLRNKYRDWLN